jgi:hypothetical protein
MTNEAYSGNGNGFLERRIQPSHRLLACELAGETVILHLENGVYYSLNEIASKVWGMIQEDKTVRQIRDALLVEYIIEESACTRDLLDLLQQLEKTSLIGLVNEERGP